MQNNQTKPTTARMPELDGLRALAVLFVISFHSWYFLRYTMPTTEIFRDYSETLPFLLGFIRRGDVGVDIFFVLSGYLLAWQLFRERAKHGSINLKRFYVHRVFRIYPLYLVVLLIATFDVGITWQFLGNILAYNVWINPMSLIAPWTWSLSIELQFYAIVPFIILLAKTQSKVFSIVVAASILSIGWSAAVLILYPNIQHYSFIDLDIEEYRHDLYIFYKYMYVAFPVRLAQFVLGLGAAWLTLNHIDKIRSLSPKYRSFAVTVVIAGLLLPLLHNPYSLSDPTAQKVVVFEQTVGRVAFALSTAILIAMLHADLLPRVKLALSARWLRLLAKYSYSMYLFHPVFVGVGIYLFVGVEGVTSVSLMQYAGVFLVAVVGSVLLGYITWKFVEYPAIRFGKRAIESKL